MGVVHPIIDPLVDSLRGSFLGGGGSGWNIGALSPLIWTQASRGITIGQEATSAGLDVWTVNAMTRTSLGGGIYRFATDGTNALHRIFRVPLSAFAATMPAVYSILAKKEAGSQTNRIRLQTQSSLLSVNLDTGVADGAAFLESFSALPVGDGWFLITMRATTGATNVSAWAIQFYDPTNTLLTWNSAGIDSRILLQQPMYLQQSILQWADPRNPTIFWNQATVAAQPHYWVDSRGPSVVFNAAHYMSANALAASFQGDDQPISFAVAADNVGVGAATTVPIAVTRSVVGDYHALRWPVGAVQAVQGGRRDSVLAFLNSPTVPNPHEPKGAVIDMYDGANRNILAANRVEVGAVVALGATVFDRFTIGAFVTGSITNQWIGRMREVAAAPAAWNTTQRVRAHKYLTSRYGY